MSQNRVNNPEANRRGVSGGAGGFGIKIIDRATARDVAISLTGFTGMSDGVNPRAVGIYNIKLGIEIGSE